MNGLIEGLRRMTGIIIDFAHQKLVKPTNINNNIPTYSNYTVIKYPGGPTISTEKITTIYYMSASTTKSTTTSTKSTSYVTTTPFDYFRKLILFSEYQTIITSHCEHRNATSVESLSFTKTADELCKFCS